ncbi:MAG: protein translocase subunit SecD, partial [Planctomycetes bacterium]|nr:protein translocase subunit SecD [Planctomycetota bacterium]
MSNYCPGRKLPLLAACVAVTLGMAATQWVAPALGAVTPRFGECKVDAKTDTSATVLIEVFDFSPKTTTVTVFYGTKDPGDTDEDWDGSVEVEKLEIGQTRYKVELAELQRETGYSFRVQASDKAKADTEATTAWWGTGEFRTEPWSLHWIFKLMIALAAWIVPFALAGRVARKLRMPDYGWKLGLIFFSIVASVVILWAKHWTPTLGIDLSGGVILVYDILSVDEETPGEGDSEATGSSERKLDMDKVVAALKKRIDPGGTAEIDIRKHGEDQILIVMPQAGPYELERIKNKVRNKGSLHFRILATHKDDAGDIELAGEVGDDVHRVTVTVPDPDAPSGERVEERGRWYPVQQGREQTFLGNSSIATRQGKSRLEVFCITPAEDEYVTGDHLSRVGQDIDPQSATPCVEFTFDSAGSNRFAALTSRNLPQGAQGIPRQLGIILNNELYSAPNIISTISKNGQISGGFTQETAQALADVLNAGSLPATLNPIPAREEVTGATLGTDTIIKGSVAITVSMLLVLVFMVVYYKFSGFVACFALLMNLLLIMAIMTGVGAAFTLAGLAGLVLTVGMAVDANVLIFERIREEIARGAALRMAIRNGFARATTTIVDANLTTLITATVLYVIGSEQVKGFAVILWLGVVLSMYTAIFCSRVIFDIAERKRWITELKFQQLLGKTKIDFIGSRRPAAIASIALILIGLAGVFDRGKGLLDIDFTGGVSIQAVFEGSQKIGDVRSGLDNLDDLAVSAVSIENETPNTRFNINTSGVKLEDWEAPDFQARLREKLRSFHGSLSDGQLDEMIESMSEVDQVKMVVELAFPGGLAILSMDFEDPVPLRTRRAVQPPVTSEPGTTPEPGTAPDTAS